MVCSGPVIYRKLLDVPSTSVEKWTHFCDCSVDCKHHDGPTQATHKDPQSNHKQRRKKQQGIFSIEVLRGKIYVLHLDNFFLREHNESKHASNFCLGPAHSQFLDKYSCHTITQ